MSAQLSIRRLNATYLVPRELPDAGAARSRLDGAMRRRLASTCRQLLSHLLEDGDTTVWLIRRLDLNLAVDVGMTEEDVLTRAWATRLAAGLARAISRGPDGQSVMRFPDRAAYLAHFLRDMAEGVAWEKWYYDTFATLRSLPTSAAMREALLREPEQTEGALRHLAGRGWLEQALSAMTEGDVLRVYEACVGTGMARGSTEEERKIIDGLLAVWHAAPVRPAQAGIARAHNALKLYVAWRLKSPATTVADSLPRAIDLLLGFAEILRRTNEPKELLSSLVNGRLGEAVERARGGGVSLQLESLPSLLRLAGGDQSWLVELARTVGINVAATVSSGKEAQPRIVNASCGGLFLMVPQMLDLNLHRLIEAAPYPDSEEWKKEQSLRYLLFLKIVRARSVDAAYDFAPRYLAGFDELPSFTDLHDFSRLATPEMNQACLWLLLEELVRRGRTDGNYLSAELIEREQGGSDDKILLVRDVVTDAWVFAAHVGEDAAGMRETLERGLKMLRQATGVEPGCLFVEKNLDAQLSTHTLAGRLARKIPDGSLFELLSAQQSGATEVPAIWMSEDALLSIPQAEMLGRALSQRRPARADLDYFSLMECQPAFVADERFDLVWTLVARALLKEFALRLMNFGWSSAEYLSRNFLEGMSTLRVEGGRVEVRLARAPLHIMLRIAGMDEQSYTVPWLNDTQVTLSPMPE